jgi:MerR family transcriptional regulator, light-induced transcriptional regulator
MTMFPMNEPAHDSAQRVSGRGRASPRKGDQEAPAQADLDAPDEDRESVELRLALLARAIEYEIIPRLMMAHRTPHVCVEAAVVEDAPLGVADVESFARLVLSQDALAAQASVDALLARGISVESIYLDLLAPVARYLGKLWDDDLCDFTDVTIGLGRLHQVLRELSPAFGQGDSNTSNGRHVLLLPSPGEQHTFGLVMVSEFFRRAGWDVAGGPRDPGANLLQMVSREWFDIIGFSLATEASMEDLRACIVAVRDASMNRHIGIMVGGPIFQLHPEYAHQVGADCATTDGRGAPDLADQVIHRLSRAR